MSKKAKKPEIIVKVLRRPSEEILRRFQEVVKNTKGASATYDKEKEIVILEGLFISNSTHPNHSVINIKSKEDISVIEDFINQISYSKGHFRYFVDDQKNCIYLNPTATVQFPDNQSRIDNVRKQEALKEAVAAKPAAQQPAEAVPPEPRAQKQEQQPVQPQQEPEAPQPAAAAPAVAQPASPPQQEQPAASVPQQERLNEAIAILVQIKEDNLLALKIGAANAKLFIEGVGKLEAEKTIANLEQVNNIVNSPDFDKNLPNRTKAQSFIELCKIAFDYVTGKVKKEEFALKTGAYVGEILGTVKKGTWVEKIKEQSNHAAERGRS